MTANEPLERVNYMKEESSQEPSADLREKKRRVEMMVWLVISMAVLTVVHFYTLLYTPATRDMEAPTVLVEVPRGSSFAKVAATLVEKGVLRDAGGFSLAASLKGAKTRIKAGEYELTPRMTPPEVLSILLRGASRDYTVTIPEGYNVFEIAAVLDAAGLLQGPQNTPDNTPVNTSGKAATTTPATIPATTLTGAASFIERATDVEFARSLGVEAPRGGMEGYLFPDTYRFTRSMSAEEIIRRMYSRFNQVYDAILAGLLDSGQPPSAADAMASNLPDLNNTPEIARQRITKGLNAVDAIRRARMAGSHGRGDALVRHKAVTLASIIEKETGVSSEMPLISTVFHNRLVKGYRLQSDPTVIYGIMVEREFDGNLTKKDLQRKTHYNTYRFHGLPPGPIANPGREALRATLNPSSGRYLYFVSRGDGTHKFSNSLVEHNKAVRKFQLGHR